MEISQILFSRENRFPCSANSTAGNARLAPIDHLLNSMPFPDDCIGLADIQILQQSLPMVSVLGTLLNLSLADLTSIKAAQLLKESTHVVAA
jgi:hypothetical protein